MGYFEKLEQVNAQIDICIDEEDYQKVDQMCAIRNPLHGRLRKAFSHTSCTSSSNSAWHQLLTTDISMPVESILAPPGDRQMKVDIKDEVWSRFFWAKLIRSKIQEKGTDCYFRRLDDVVAYLERSLPVFSNDKLQAKLAVIYLLEMSAGGLGADHRSFAERARRILQEKLVHKNYKSFRRFYDLVARYNIGIGYFHEHMYRNAVLEFNKIIHDLTEILPNKYDNKSVGDKRFRIFTKMRNGFQLLYFPAIIYRAETQNQLQIAYHAFETINICLTNDSIISEYKRAKSDLVCCEAYEQMGQSKESFDALGKVYTFAFGDKAAKQMRSRAFRVSYGESRANLKTRIQNQLAAEFLEDLKTGNIERVKKFFDAYYKSVERKKFSRQGYFEQAASFLFLIAGKLDNPTKAMESYRKNKIYGLLEDESQHPSCPCKEKGIDLRRLPNQKYEEFEKNLLGFFKTTREKLAEINPVSVKELIDDETLFRKRLHHLEEKERNDLAWRVRRIKTLPATLNERWCGTCGRILSTEAENSFASLTEPKCVKMELNEKGRYLLTGKDYEKIMNTWDRHFLEHLRFNSLHKPNCPALHFLGLQRWNSTSPARGQSVGGGYLLYCTDDKGKVDFGVAIDPGFDFLRNLFHEGFSLYDIDLVLLSHAHLDHIRDFESMVTLLLELKKRTKIKRKLHVVMTLGVYRRLEHIIESPGLREFIDPYIIDIEKEIDQQFLDHRKFKFIRTDSNKNPSRIKPLSESQTDQGLSVTVEPKRAYHDDFSEYSDSYGFLLEISDAKNKSLNFKFGYSGDTSWNEDIIEQYRSCDALLLHLGSLIDREDPKKRTFGYYDKPEKCVELIQDKNHPYLAGMLHFLAEIDTWNDKKPLVFMSEFGEEMRGKIRLDLMKRLKGTYSSMILPVDVGLDVVLGVAKPNSNGGNVSPDWEEALKWTEPVAWCAQCDLFVNLADIDFEVYGHDEALFSVCRTCKSSATPNVLQDRLRYLYEVGRELHPARQ